MQVASTSPGVSSPNLPEPQPLNIRDPEQCAVSATYWAARVLLAALDLGQNIDRLARQTGCKRSFVARCARRLVDNGVWAGGETVCEWTVEREAHPSFWMDVAVAEGRLFRRTNADGTLEWGATGVWLKSFERPLRETDLPMMVQYVARPVPAPEAPLSPIGDRTHPNRSAEGATAHSGAFPPLAAASLPPPAPRQPEPPADRLCALYPDAVWLG